MVEGTERKRGRRGVRKAREDAVRCKKEKWRNELWKSKRETKIRREGGEKTEKRRSLAASCYREDQPGRV